MTDGGLRMFLDSLLSVIVLMGKNTAVRRFPTKGMKITITLKNPSIVNHFTLKIVLHLSVINCYDDFLETIVLWNRGTGRDRDTSGKANP
jgi:hypothetical protein